MAKSKLLITEHNQKLYTLLISDNRLLSADITNLNNNSLVGNVYIGKVTNIALNIQAAFININPNLSCYLPLSEQADAIIINRTFDGVLKCGDEVIVQVKKEAVKTKQPTVTTSITFTGKNIIFSSKSHDFSLSKKMNNPQKEEICNYLVEHNLISKTNEFCQNNECFSIIIRTNAQYLDDYQSIIEEWNDFHETYQKLLKEAPYRTCYSCLYEETKPYMKSLMNYYHSEYEEIVTDLSSVFEDLQKAGYNIRFYKDEYPLAMLYNIRKLIDDALNKRVWLKSGAYLIIEATEALTTIDVNTGKYEGLKDTEATFRKINLEAVKEIAIQLRLRNISGIIIIDFINLKKKEYNDELMQELSKSVKEDHNYTQVIDMTKLGLVELTRKRSGKSLNELINEF